MALVGIRYACKPEDNRFAYAIAVERRKHILNDFPAGTADFEV